jgi:nucleoside-diphosphate-sugar epimerase
MTTALIGSTGFVGSHILRQIPVQAVYHSRTIPEIRGRHYDLIICAGVRAEKWKANLDPVADRAGIAALTEHLLRASCQRLVLISTVDVYPNPIGVDEDSPIDPAQASPYGRHRYELELLLSARFPTTIIRLPGLFGSGLKKNILFDLLNNHQVEKIQPRSVFQFYNLENLAADLRWAIESQLTLVNFATQPIETAELVREVFGRELPERPSQPVIHYDIRTRHAECFGRRDGYLYGKRDILDDLTRFVASYPTQRAAA